MLVPTATRAALCDDDPRAGLREVGDELLALEDLRSHRDAEHRVVSARTVGKTPTADSAAARTELLVRAESRKIAPTWIGDDHDVAAVTAVTAVRPPARYVLLATEVDRAVAATAGDGRQARAVVEHDLLGV
jgi:hypothetical protein